MQTLAQANANPFAGKTPDELMDILRTNVLKYHPSSDLSIIEKAYQVAVQEHGTQERRSGEPYIIHPLCVAIILSELDMDKETICAGLLHDVLEDTKLTQEQMTKLFGEEITQLVVGVTKLSNLSYSMDKVEVQAENLRKMFLAMAKDIRVIIVKLADRLHNMRTMQYMPVDKQIEKSRETIEIFSPIADRLGIAKIKIELDDLALMYLEPEAYKDLAVQISDKIGASKAYIESIVNEVKVHIEEAGIDARIDGRVKHFFSIYKKMVNQNKSLAQIFDLYAVRIIVDDIKDCYAALGVIHEMYRPVPGRFKDYIAMPKGNMYQSLHTTLIGPAGHPFEIQIRTVEMHHTAEYGIAAHWKYKESKDGLQSSESEQSKLSWLRQILEWQQEMSDNSEFLSLLKSDLDLYSESVLCFTPEGDVKTLPAGSTPIDFAYSVHSAVGNRMVGARVNNRMVSNNYEIQTGDVVEIITSGNSKGPSRDWLAIVKSTQAKNKILQWFKAERKEDNIVKGKEMLAAHAKAKGVLLPDLLKKNYIEATMAKYGFRDFDSIYAAIGHGGLKEGQILNKLIEEQQKELKKNITDAQILDTLSEYHFDRDDIRRSKGGIVVSGTDDVAVHFPKCCSPVPGDEIVGFVTRGRGISIHRTDCVNVINCSPDDKVRLISAEWNSEAMQQKDGRVYSAQIKIFARNRTGLLVDLSKIFAENNIDLKSMHVHVNKHDVATLMAGFEITGTDELNTITNKILSVESVIDLERATG
jgi:GTP pyrophosphokinase